MSKILHIILMSLIYFGNIRFIPAYILFKLSKNTYLKEDFKVWKSRYFPQKNDFVAFFRIFWMKKEFRSLIYYRLGHESLWISWMAKGLPVVSLTTSNIGPGFFLNHGDCSRINAKSIGKNFMVWHGVTIGVGRDGDNNTRPTIGDNVRICAGALVFGDIHIGNNVTIGAGSVVTKSIPDNCVVVGNPARIIKENK